MHVAQAGGALGHPWRQPSNLLTITGTLMAVGRECSVFRRGPVSGFSSLCLLAFPVRWIREAQGGLRGNAGRFIVRKGMVQAENGNPVSFQGRREGLQPRRRDIAIGMDAFWGAAFGYGAPVNCWPAFLRESLSAWLPVGLWP